MKELYKTYEAVSLDFKIVKPLSNLTLVAPISNPTYADVSRDIHGTSYKQYEERGCRK